MAVSLDDPKSCRRFNALGTKTVDGVPHMNEFDVLVWERDGVPVFTARRRGWRSSAATA